MKCTRCKGKAAVEVRRHHASFCPECFVHHCRRQVGRAIAEHKMLAPAERVAVAVSGGKDSLALWDILLDLGYDAVGIHLQLGIGSYSEASEGFARTFAARRGVELSVVRLDERAGFDIPTAARSDNRAPCGACGLSKRYLLNKVALDSGHDVVATGHNLDDEAAVLMGTTLNWSLEEMARQAPALGARPGFARRVKPLVRLSELESAAYCILGGIDYVVDECPMAEGNRQLALKAALALIEERSPNVKGIFYQGFLERLAPLLASEEAVASAPMAYCSRCGAPTTSEVCAFCRLSERLAGASRAGETTTVGAPRTRRRGRGSAGGSKRTK